MRPCDQEKAESICGVSIPPLAPVVVFHELHFPILRRDLKLQRLHLLMGDVVECLDSVLESLQFVGAALA